MATAPIQKNGHELAEAWLRREQPAKTRTRHQADTPSIASERDENKAAPARVFRCDRSRGFFRG